jgi:hypothetical protein
MNIENYNYIWDKWLKAYRSGDFSEMDKESVDTLIKARGYLHLNHVHANDWKEFNKYIDERKSDEEKSQPFMLEPNFYGMGIKFKPFWTWIKKKFNKNT